MSTLEKLLGGPENVIGGPFGSKLTQKDYTNAGVPVIRGSNMISTGRWLSGEYVYVSEEKVEADLRSNLAVSGDIIVTQRGTLGQVAIVPEKHGFDRYVISQSQMAVRVPKRAADRDFVYYFLQSPQFVAYVETLTIQTGVPHINLGILRSTPATWPAKEQQIKLASILTVLDDKIELNRRMNETLETMARAIFKDWFVDFGPTRAKMEDRAPYLAPELWDLFPDALDDEDKPVGWTKRSVYEFADIIYGAPFSSKQFNTEEVGIPLIRIRDLVTHEPGIRTEEIHKKGHLIQPGDIIVGMDGEFRLHIWKGPEAWLNQRVCHFEPKIGVPKSYLAEALKVPLAFFERGKVGTTVIHLGKSDIDTFELVYPGKRVLDAFAKAAEPLIEGSVSNALQSRTLAQTRDLLLPKLMSGEISLSEAEKMVEAAV